MDLFNLEEEMELFNKKLSNVKNDDINKIKPTDLKISIMSATSSFNSLLNLKTLSLLLKKDSKIFFIDSTFNMTRKISSISKKKYFIIK